LIISFAGQKNRKMMVSFLFVLCKVVGGMGPSTKKPLAGGFGKAQAQQKQPDVSASALLEKSERKYDALEAQYDGSDGLVFREFVVAVRCQASCSMAVRKQLSDWVPVCVLGAATEIAASDALPVCVFRHRREVVEATRQVLSGPAAKQVVSAALDFSYESLDAWQSRILDSVEATTASKRDAITEARKILGVDIDADAQTIKKMYRVAFKEAHPDAAKSTDVIETTVDDLRLARDLLLGAMAGSAYETIGKASDFVGPLDFSKAKSFESPIDAAVQRLEPDLLSPFLYRNVQTYNSQQQRRQGSQ